MRVQWIVALMLAAVALTPQEVRAQTSHPGFGDDERAPTGAPLHPAAGAGDCGADRRRR